MISRYLRRRMAPQPDLCSVQADPGPAPPPDLPPLAGDGLHHIPSLYFLHIPKTAGTSVREWLRDLFHEADRVPADHLPELEALPVSQLRHRAFLTGHFGWRGVERAMEAGHDPRVVTFLREPTALAISGARYAAALDERYLESFGEDHAQVRYVDLAKQGHHIPPEERDWIDDHFSNVQVRFLAGPGTQAGEPWRVTRADLALARRRLETLDCFGLVEEMDWSAALFADALALPFRSMELRLNATQSPAGVGPRFADFAREVHALDYELHAFAQELFADRVAKLKRRHGLGAEDPPAALADALRARFAADLRGRPPLGFSMRRRSQAAGLITEGFRPRFFHEPTRRWLRWSGPGRESVLYLPLLRSEERRLRFEVAFWPNETIRDGLEVLVDGQVLEGWSGYEMWDDGAFHMIREVTIPALAPAAPTEGEAAPAPEAPAGYTAIRFRVPEVVEVAGMGLKGEPAPVGFAIADFFVF